ncbi:MAG: trans-hexaprenyltranstransferase, partial [Betaproteobacteria bacterium]|nr:trans-hexaprenyltranstransferase [Betaproteobacteria bacterium]
MSHLPALADAQSRAFQGPPGATFYVSSLMSVPFLQDLIADDMCAVDAVIRRRLASDVALVRNVAEYIVGSGGKRLRPALVILSAGALGYQGNQHHELAAVVEF